MARAQDATLGCETASVFVASADRRRALSRGLGPVYGGSGIPFKEGTQRPTVEVRLPESEVVMYPLPQPGAGPMALLLLPDDTWLEQYRAYLPHR